MGLGELTEGESLYHKWAGLEKTTAFKNMAYVNGNRAKGITKECMGFYNKTATINPKTGLEEK